MKKNKIRIIAAALALCTGLAACGKKDADVTTGTSAAVTDDVQPADAVGAIAEGTILHAWCWSFDTVKESMQQIADAGYTAVQISPANEVIVGGDGGMQLMGKGKWYYQYQPTDWKIGNYQMGTEQEFTELCAEAKKCGVSVIVDVVPNHTAADISAVSQSLIDAVGGTDMLYHKNWQKKISNYSSRIECTSYSLSGLPDVNTENPAFQDYFIAYLNKLIECGVDGFRYDTAKHIALPDDPVVEKGSENNFWPRVTNDITRPVFQYGEVLQGDGERIGAYIEAIGRTTASKYGEFVRSSVRSRLMEAKALNDFMVGGSSDVVTWVESHDNYTDGTSAGLTDTQIILGWALIAGRGEGTPLFFDRPYGASPDDMWGSMNRIGAKGSPLFMSQPVAAVNHFRQAMAGKPTELRNSDDSKILMVERGSSGMVVINYKDEKYAMSVKCSLPDGEYKDRSGMNGTFTVSGGIISGDVAPDTIAVLYNEGYEERAPMAEVSIETESFVIDGSLDVTLRVSGADHGTYILGSEEKSYSDGEKLTIPQGIGELKLKAENSDGKVSAMTYYFTEKQTVPAGAVISFVKPESWGTDIHVYIYNETVSPVRKNASWPGESMTLSDDGTYSYTLADEWDSALVIFNDGKNQYPAAMEPGVELVSGKTYSVP